MLRAKWAIWACFGLAASAAACSSVRRFLIPPATVRPQDQRALALRQAGADVLLVAGTLHGRTEKAVAIHGDRIMAVGMAADVTALRTADTLYLKLPSAYATIGFVDAHVHLEGAAMLRDAADLRRAASMKDVFAAVEIARGVAGDWLWGFGLSDALWRKATSEQIAAACGDSPCYLSRADGHGGLVSAALIERLSPDLQQAIVANQGRVEGEFARQVWRSLPPVRSERLRPLVCQVLDDFAKAGVVEMHAMGESMALVNALRQLEREGRLPLRVAVYIDAERPEAGELLEGRLRAPPTPRVRVAGIKLWLDGTLGAHTAALQLPYADTPTHGELRYGDGELRERIRDADKAGLQVAVHAIGDAAVAQILRVVKGMQRKADAQPIRIEHAQVVPPELREQLWGAKFECSVQPRHAAQDAGFAAQRLGSERMAWAYPALGLAPVCAVRSGSDLPVAPADPLGDWAAMAKMNPAELGADATAGTVSELALAALSGAGSPRGNGVVRAGEPADLVLWDRDPFAAGAKAKALYLIVGGQLQQVVAD